MMVAVCGLKGSPGATSTALALGAAWPRPANVVEADVYGGDLGFRVRRRRQVLPAVPTVLSLASSARGVAPDPGLVDRTCHRMSEQLGVLPGPAAAEQTTGISSWEPLAAVLAASQTDVVVDLGRIHAGSPTLPVAAAADVVVLVGRGDAGSMGHLRERVHRLAPVLAERGAGRPVVWCVLVAKARHGPTVVAEFEQVLAGSSAGVMVTGIESLAHDPGALQRLESAEDPHGRLGRSLLLRSAGEITRAIAGPSTASTLVGDSAGEGVW